jgi:hypothetical protein
LLEAINSGRLDQRTRSANDNLGIARAPNVTIHNYAGVEIETRQGPTHQDVEIIARRVVREDSPKAVAHDMGQSNSRTQKALSQHYGVGKKRP